MDKHEQALSLRASGYVKRWHTFQHLGQAQTNAEHSAQALSLLFLLYPQHSEEDHTNGCTSRCGPSMNLVKSLLWHDHAERVVGDVPAPVRRANPEFAAMYEAAEEDFFEKHSRVWHAMCELTIHEREWLKAIDTLELLCWCYDQVMLGNRHAEIVRHRAQEYLMTSEVTPVEVREFVQYISGEYRSFA